MSVTCKQLYTIFITLTFEVVDFQAISIDTYKGCQKTWGKNVVFLVFNIE